MSEHAISYKITLLMGAYFNLVVPNNKTFLCLNQLEEKGANNIAKEISERVRLGHLQSELLLKRKMGMTVIKLRSPMREAVKL